MTALLVAILVVQLLGFVCARFEARRQVHATLARTPAEYVELRSRPVRSGRCRKGTL